MTSKTTAIKLESLDTKWHFMDAEGKVLGRFATEIAKILMGKNKAIFTYTGNVGDKVVVINAAKIVVTGKKLKDKEYNWYTGYPGGLRTQTLEVRLAKTPTKVLQAAILGMLPKNRLQRERMSNLYIYAGAEHPHTAQQKNLESAKKNA